MTFGPFGRGRGECLLFSVGRLRRLGWLTAAAGAVLLPAVPAGPAPAAATAGRDVPAAPGLPDVAGWGVGVAPPAYGTSTIWLVPHPDDEGGLWADELDSDATSFPVFVYLTNGENTGSCTDDGSLHFAPAGNLGSADRPPFNTAGDIPGAPQGYVGAGLPPQADGAQGDDPPVYPADPPLSRQTGWDPLESASTYTGLASNGVAYTEGFSGPCRAARLAAVTMMFSQMNRVVATLSPAADRARFPSVAPGAPPDGQRCFTGGMGELYTSENGRYSAPQPSGLWTASDSPSGVTSPKDGCAYYWLTPTGDVFAFDLGDGPGGPKNGCPSNEWGRLRTGPAWPGGVSGYDSVGAYPESSRPGVGNCTTSLPAGQEGYSVSASDAVWAVQAVAASGLLPSSLPVAALASTGWVNGFNPAVDAPHAAAGIDVESNHPTTSCAYLTGGGSVCPPQPAPAAVCQPYMSSAHAAAALAVQWNDVLPGVAGGVAVCAGDPLATRTFGTTNPADGRRFWTDVFDYDGGAGWEASALAYGWLTGMGAFDPYGQVTDTCPGSAAVAVGGQSQWSCQESVTSSAGTAPNAPAVPGDGVAGMSNRYVDPSGEHFTLPT